MPSFYQTTPMPDGTLVKGLFATDEWFRRIKKHVDFEGKDFLDIGCCTCSYGIQAVAGGARSVIGVDESAGRISESRQILDTYGVDNIELIHQRVEDFFPARRYDIAIFSMVIYWIEDAEYHVKRLVDKVDGPAIFVFRLGEHDGSVYFQPTVSELSQVVGRFPAVEETLVHTDEQHIELVIF